MTDFAQMFYAPADGFELSVTRLGDPQPSPGHGGRIVLRVGGKVIFSDVKTDQLRLLPG